MAWRNLTRAFLYLCPSLVIFTLFVFYPLVKSIRLSLHETNIIGVEKFYVGFSQYVEIFTTGNFGHNLWLTLLFSVYTVFPGLIIGMVLAYIANWRLKGIGIFRTNFASPLVIAVASASMIWMLLFNPSAGVLTFFLSKLGMQQVNWLSDPKWALFSVCVVSVWRSLGFNTIVLLSGLQAIPEQLYESARIDGAGPFRQFKDITLPMMSPTLFFVFIVSVINALQTFGEINILTQGGPAGATNVIVYSIYREAFFNFHFSYASAQALILFLIILVLTVLEFLILEKKGVLPMRRLIVAGQYLVLCAASLLLLFPVLYALLVSFQSAAESVSYPPVFIPSELHWQSYVKAMQTAPIFHFIFNSFVVSAVVTVGQLVTASLAAYAFSFLTFPGRNAIFYIFLSTMMIPWEVTIIPNYFTIRELNWLDTYQGLAVPFLASAFGTFLLRQAFMTLPRELYDAARIDGCGHFRFFLTMVLLLSRPALGTLAVYSFLMTYNQYLWPLLVTNKDTMRTVQIGLAMLQWDQAAAWNSIMAGVILVSLPAALLLIAGQKQLVRGMTAGALKG